MALASAFYMPCFSSPAPRPSTSLFTLRSIPRAEPLSAPAQHGIAGLEAKPSSWSRDPLGQEQPADSEVDRWWEIQPYDKQNEESAPSNHRSPYSPRKPPPGRKRNWYLSNDFVHDLILRVRNAEGSREGMQAALVGWREPLTPRNMVTVINRVDAWEKAYYFFQWLKGRDDYNLNTFVYNVVLKVLQKAKQWELCEGLAEAMIGEGFVPDNFTYSILINCAKRCALPDKALEWFERMSDAECVPDQVTYNCILDVLGSCGRMDEAVKLYEKLRGSGWRPDSVTCAIMANVYAKLDKHWEIEKLYWEMQEMGIEPNVVYYNTYIQALSRSGKLTLAVNIFKQMEELGIRPSSVTLTILIDMYARVGAIQKAFDVFEKMEREGLAVDVVAYNALISACAEHGLVAQAEELMGKMIEQRRQPNAGTYRAMMNVYASKGMTRQVQEMFDKFEANGYDAGTQTYATLMRACKQACDFDKVPGYFDQMIAKGHEPNDRVCGVLLACVTSCEDSDVTKNILNRVKRWYPNAYEVVEKLIDNKDIEADWLQKKLTDTLSELQEDSHRSFFNIFIDISSQFRRRKESHQILATGKSLHIFDNLESQLDTEWRLNLRTLSFSSAQCALESWLNSLHLAMSNGQEMPALFVIETGSGKRRAVDKVRLNGFVYSLLEKMEAPFEDDESEIGTLKATGLAMKSWLESRPPEEFSHFRRNLNASFQDSSLNAL